MSSCSIFLSLTFTRYGRVDGESSTEGYEGQIEVGGFGWGLGRLSARDHEQAAKKEEKTVRKGIREVLLASQGIDPETGMRVEETEEKRNSRAQSAHDRLISRTTVSGSQMSLKEFSFIKRFDLSSTVMLSALNSQDEIKEACFTVLRFGQPSKDSTVLHSPIYTVKLRRGRVAALTMAVQSEGNAGWALVDTVAFKYRSVDVEYFPVPKAEAARPVGKVPAKSIGRGAAPPAPPGSIAPTRQAGIPFSYNGP